MKVYYTIGYTTTGDLLHYAQCGDRRVLRRVNRELGIRSKTSARRIPESELARRIRPRAH